MTTAPPPPPTKPKSTSRMPQQPTSLTVGAAGVMGGRISQGERILIYGPGGIGKTELVAGLSQVGINMLWLDLDLGSLSLDVDRASIDGELVHTFAGVRSVLQNQELTASYDGIVIDTLTAGEDLLRQFVIETVKHEHGKPVSRIEDYGFGKGYVHIFETALLLLQDLDSLVRQRKHIVLICHQCVERVPSAESEDYLEYQPRLQSPPRAGKLRERVFEWCNHVFRIDHDRAVKEGKVAAGDTRAIHTVRTTTAWAKHRTMGNGREFPAIIPYPKGDVTLWEIMFGDNK